MTLGAVTLRRAWRRFTLVWMLLLLAALPGVAHAQDYRVLGTWEQFVLVDNTGTTWRMLGTYRVEKSGGAYQMEPVNQVQSPTVITSKGLSNVHFAGTLWRFDSDWGNRDVGQFRLRRIAPGVYQGWSYLQKKQVNPNLWVLVQ